MKICIIILGATMLVCSVCRAAPQSPNPGPPPVAPKAEAAARGDSDRRADKRYEEMLARMQAAVEEVAQLYGNPIFLQVFTNDKERASALKERLRSVRTGEEARFELAALEKKREDLLSDIALKERETARLTGKLVRQRAAIDALADAVEKARTAVEDTAR
jgi:hypothetical protein